MTPADLQADADSLASRLRFIGPGVAKLSPGAIRGLSRKRCSETVGRCGESRRVPGQHLGNFPEDGRTRESRHLALEAMLIIINARRGEHCAHLAPDDSFATPRPCRGW